MEGKKKGAMEDGHYPFRMRMLNLAWPCAFLSCRFHIWLTIGGNETQIFQVCAKD